MSFFRVAKQRSSQFDRETCSEAIKACACSNFRKASRVVTQLFDEILQPSGLRSTQLVILLQIAASESDTVSRMASELAMDRSTLTRNLDLLTERGLIRIVPGKDRRKRLIRMTPRGRDQVLKAIPLWERAQTRFVKELGPQLWSQTVSNLARAVEAGRVCMKRAE